MNRLKLNKSKVRELIRKFISFLVHIVKFLWAEGKKQYLKILDKLRLSLAFRITLIHVQKIIGSLLFVEFIVHLGFIVYLGLNIQSYLDRDFKIAKEYLSIEKEIPKDRLKLLAELDSLTITVFDKDKKLLFSTKEEGIGFFDKTSDRYSTTINKRFLILENIEPRNYNWKLDTNNQNYSFSYIMSLNENINWNGREIYLQLHTKMTKEISSVFILFWGLLGINLLVLIGAIISGSKSSRKILKPIHNMNGVVENITINKLATRLDVSGIQDELKDLARTFNTTMDRIQLAYEQQNQFVSDASHELRTPIAVIQGYANMLDRWGKDDEAVLLESIGAIKTEAENMKELVEKLLFLARGDKNTQRVELESINLRELIDKVIKETVLIDNIHDISCEQNEDITITGDINLLKEAIRIFVDNSIKYTPEGGTIRINSIRAKGNALITVEDTGIGISKEDLPHIFDRFYRADKSRTKNTGGTGLGLAIAKWIVDKHKGKINVESEINKGTKISITIPY